jgi:hypothetical protein
MSDIKVRYETGGAAAYTFRAISGETYTLCTFGPKTNPTLAKHESIHPAVRIDRPGAASILRAAREVRRQTRRLLRK